jgi:predicted RNase H-like HicB family nuclease
MATETVHAVIYKSGESDHWVAVCLEYNVASQGDSEEHAKAMIKEAVELHLEDMTREEIELLYQPIEGEPRVHELSINARSLPAKELMRQYGRDD